MTKEEAQQILESGEGVEYRVWSWYGRCRSCGDEHNCCADCFESIEETLDDIDFFCGGNWDEVTECKW